MGLFIPLPSMERLADTYGEAAAISFMVRLPFIHPEFFNWLEGE